MAPPPKHHPQTDTEWREDATYRSSHFQDNHQSLTQHMGSARYGFSDRYRERQTSLEELSPSSSSMPPLSSLELSQQGQRCLQDVLPYRQNSVRGNAGAHDVPGNAGSDVTYTQAGPDSCYSGSAFESLTPNSSVSSQRHSEYGESPTSLRRPSAAKKQRYWLYVRQQPRAGRACPNSRDRRGIDPPPVVQLQISDFDPNSPEDMEDMRDQSLIVHCLLCSASSPKRDLSIMMGQDESNGAMRAEKQINGNLDASPFFCDEDPDPSTAPRHPSSQLYCPLQSPPRDTARRNLPATFFYFADLSIRRAGVYRLEFQLMRMRMDQRQFSVLHSVLSEPFNVVNAKDFDHVQASTTLVRELVARGAGFPLKLKQGSRAHRTSPEE